MMFIQIDPICTAEPPRSLLVQSDFGARQLKLLSLPGSVEKKLQNLAGSFLSVKLDSS